MKKITITLLAFLLFLTSAILPSCSNSNEGVNDVDQEDIVQESDNIELEQTEESVEIEQENEIEESEGIDQETSDEIEEASSSSLPEWAYKTEEIGKKYEVKWTAFDKDAYEMIVSDAVDQTEIFDVALYAIRKAYKEAGTLDIIVCGYYENYERVFTYDPAGNIFYGYFNDSPDYEFTLEDHHIEDYIKK